MVLFRLSAATMVAGLGWAEVGRGMVALSDAGLQVVPTSFFSFVVSVAADWAAVSGLLVRLWFLSELAGRISIL